MDCIQASRFLHGYLDHEIDAITASAIEQHLLTCVECARAYARQNTLKAAVRQHSTYHTAPDALANRIRREIGSRKKLAKTKASSHWQWYRLGGAVAESRVTTYCTGVEER
jgi:mycothiol system anti-sigma-R factor